VGVKRERRDRDGVTTFEHADQWLYPNYLTWCQEQGRLKPVSSRKFRDTLIDMAETLGHPVTHQQAAQTRSRVICGIRLATANGKSSSGYECNGELARFVQVIDFNLFFSESSESSGFLENSSQNFSQNTSMVLRPFRADSIFDTGARVARKTRRCYFTATINRGG
jgi:hypothetical protein